MDAVEKALSIIDLLGTSSEGKRLTEIARDLGLPLSTVHRLLSVLRKTGYVNKDATSGRYVLGSKILRLQVHVMGSLTLTRTALPVLRRLANQLEGAANLSILQLGRVLYLESVPSDRAVSLYTPPGMTAPAHCTAMGKVLLAHLAQEDLDAWMATNTLERFTEQTIICRSALVRELERIRSDGVAIDNQEWVSGVGCVAAPIRNHAGEVIAAVSISAPAAQIIGERQCEVINAVTEACREISAALGWQESVVESSRAGGQERRTG
jgi:DNA-binding IclR family transcriptional regulator